MKKKPRMKGKREEMERKESNWIEGYDPVGRKEGRTKQS